MSSRSLTARLQALSDTYRTTLTLIQRLQKLPSAPGTFTDSGSHDPRLELSAEIHQSLREQEDELESLRLEVDDAISPTSAGYGGGVGGGRKRRDSEQIQERDRAAAMVAKLAEDLNM
jgi:protein transport protein SEC20